MRSKLAEGSRLTANASNACKFTPAGGRITCSTRLVFPAHLHPEPRRVPRPQAELEDVIEEVLVTPGDEVGPTFSYPVAGDQGAVDNPPLQCKSPLKRIVVRIEVTDTGSGIPPREITQGKLFSKPSQVLNHFGSNFPHTHSYL